MILWINTKIPRFTESTTNKDLKMDFTKKLSIIVPVYNMNHDGNLSFCLDSLVAQTVKDLEIIAVNDASTDDSLDVLYDYEKKYPDILASKSINSFNKNLKKWRVKVTQSCPTL